MKKTTILIIICSIFALGSLFANVEVVFENPEEYRDIDYGDGQTTRGIKIHIPRLEKHIKKQAERYLKEGQSLSMTITDIDLAGEYEPWRSIDFDDVRIVKAIYPPRVSFSYELKDNEGNILTDSSFHCTIGDHVFDRAGVTQAHLTPPMLCLTFGM